MNLIEIKDLEKIYVNEGVGTAALRGISFNIPKGEFVAVMGQSGSGKSTLLQILGFLDHQSKGKYYFDGKSFDDYSENEVARARNKKMGFIFQSFNLLAGATVFENVKLPLLYSEVEEKKWDEIAKNAIEAVGLAHRIYHNSSQLSGGEKQRVAIARALVNHPEVIFADEPTGNLDSKSGQVVMEIIQKLNKEHGHTVILITHETYTAEYADRIITLHDGNVESDNFVKNQRKIGDNFIK